MTIPALAIRARGRLGAYLRYQLQDFLFLRAGLPAVIVMLFGYMMWKSVGRPDVWQSSYGLQFRTQIFRNMAGVFITLGGFMGIARLVTDDRSNGYFRFLFSKPVSIERFYIQQWFLHGVGLVAITGLLAAWLQAGTGPLPVRQAMVVMGLFWILIGGIGFALSATTNYDALLLVLFYVLTSVLRALKTMHPSPMAGWLAQVTRLFPPLQKLDFIRDQLYAGAPMPWMHAAHVAVYGLLAFAAGVVILRRSSFAR